jgi:hypothetical protein
LQEWLAEKEESLTESFKGFPFSEQGQFVFRPPGHPIDLFLSPQLFTHWKPCTVAGCGKIICLLVWAGICNIPEVAETFSCPLDACWIWVGD